MHTSKVLRSSHFQYWQVGAEARTRSEFSAFCSNYHEQDRAGVVSPRLEDGVLHAGYGVLALTTAFYDLQRSRMSDFFIYPQHFAFIDAGHKGVLTGVGRLALTMDEAGLGAAWSWLDVWPASNWITVPGLHGPTPDGPRIIGQTAMLQKVFDLQINRLFWPQDFKPTSAHDYVRTTLSEAGFKDSQSGMDTTSNSLGYTGLLPDYARKLLKARLKSVYYYNTSAPTVEIHAAQPVAAIVQESINRLPKAVRQARVEERSSHSSIRPPNDDDYPYCESYRQVSVDDFLEDMRACFETPVASNAIGHELLQVKDDQHARDDIA